MRKIMLIGVCSLPLLGGCRQNETDQMAETDRLALEASVSDLSRSRTESGSGGTSTTFVEGDELGFFMPGEERQVKWTLSSGVWNAETPLSWENKVDEFEFCAYYPYSSGTGGRGKIPMPDLSAQTGAIEEIGAFDFLAARCTSSYPEGAGTVSFTGEDAFVHVCPMLSVTIMKDRADEEVYLSGAKMEAPGLFSRSEYKFGETPDADGPQLTEDPAIDGLTLTYAEPVEVTESGHTVYIVCNPVSLGGGSEFSISYTRDGISYTASTDRLVNDLVPGTCYKYTLRLTKEGLELVGMEIAGWDEETVPDIALEENPVG